LKAFYNIDEDFAKFKDMKYQDLITNIDLLPSKQFDKYILEKLDKIAVVKADIHWQDLGSWDNVYDINGKDTDNNVVKGDNIVVDETKNSLIYSTTSDRLIAIQDMEDIVVVNTQDVVYIGKR
jgi:mannose-1-phosphate guanylyltransferase